MKNSKVIDEQAKIEALIAQIERLRTELAFLAQHQELNQLEQVSSLALDRNKEIEAHLANYLCVRISGFLEVAIREICKEYIKNNSVPGSQLEYYTNQQWKRGLSFRRENILNLLREFNKEWATEFTKTKMPNSGDLHIAIDTVVNSRNAIAHGEDSDITLSELKAHFDKIKVVVEEIEKQFNP